MFSNLNMNIQKELKHLKRRYVFLRIKWTLLFLLPILIIVLAYHVTKQFLKIKMKELGSKIKEPETEPPESP